MTILQERIYPNIPNNVYNVILNMTSDNGVANAKTKWVCQQVTDKKIRSLDDGEPDYNLQDLLYAYDKFKTKLKPIINFKDRFELEDEIARVRNDGYQTNSELIAKARKGAKKVYNDENFVIYQILNVDACRRYGANTKWCITNRANDSTFKYYQDVSNGEIYFIIDKKNKDIKYACVGNCMFDETDSIIMEIPDEIENYSSRGIYDDELAWRIDSNPHLKDVIPYAFPSFDKQLVMDTIEICANL